MRTVQVRRLRGYEWICPQCDTVYQVGEQDDPPSTIMCCSEVFHLVLSEAVFRYDKDEVTGP